MIRIKDADEFISKWRDKMAQKRSLYPYREAKISPAMWIIGSIIVIIVTIVPFIIMQIPSLA